MSKFNRKSERVTFEGMSLAEKQAAIIKLQSVLIDLLMATSRSC